MYLTLGVNILDSTTETQLVLSSQYNVGETVCIAKAYMYLWITLVLLIDLCMHLISPPVKSRYINKFNLQD